MSTQADVKQETFDFEADVSQVMSIIINHVYSSKELFLRELVSNASDALEKLLRNKNSLEEAGYATIPTCDFRIQIIPDKANKTLTIKDNGIGMTKADLINFLGSIASSGTKMFKDALDKANNKNYDELIGQFGMGFYSAFLVADRVEVYTKNPKDEGYIWTSDGSSGYSIAPYDIKEHGTAVVLRIKQGDESYLDAEKLKDIIRKHNMFVKYKVSIVTEKKKEEKKEGEEEVQEVDGENETDESKIQKDQEEKENLEFDEEVLTNEPIWTKNIKDIPEEELKKFYKTISSDYDDYAAVQSWHYEGSMGFDILLFIPKRSRLNFFEKNKEKNRNIKLFNANVFVTDDLGIDVVPDWMNFVVGVISSKSFPMNVSREFLQGKGPIKTIKNKLPKCIAEMIKQLQNDEEKYNTFYKEFANNIKFAVRELTDDLQATYANFLRYNTNMSKDKLLSLDDYISKHSNEKQILFITGLNKKEVEGSLYLEAYPEREILLMHEASDEIMLQGLKTYNGYNFQNISAEGVLEPGQEEPKEEAKNEAEGEKKEEPKDEFKEFISETLKGKIERTEFINKVMKVPAIILTTKYSASGAMENIIRSHPGSESNPMMMMMMQTRKIFELNTEHDLSKKAKELFESGDKDGASKYINFIFNSALLGYGFVMEDKPQFIKQLFELISSCSI